MLDKKVVWRYVMVVGVVLLILFCYSAGRLRGSFEGIQMGLVMNNDTFCEFVGRETNRTWYLDDDSVCVMDEDVKYSVEVECLDYKYALKGKRDMEDHEKVGQFMNKVFYYPFLGCW